jgi:hypothetical protein
MSTDIKLSLKLANSESQIANMIMQNIGFELNEVLRKSAIGIRDKLRLYFQTLIENDNTWQSLKSGTLKAHFGLPDAEERLSTILSIWLNSIMVDYTPIRVVSTKLKGGLSINMLETDWEDVISADVSSIVTNSGEVLPWLEWLLKFGDKIIVRDYEIKIGPSVRSRSGMAIMVKKAKGKWRVPPEYSGTTNNNFVTKLLDNIDKDTQTIVENEIESQL